MLLLLIIVLVLLFGGSGGYRSYRYGYRDPLGGVAWLLVILLIIWLVAGGGLGHRYYVEGGCLDFACAPLIETYSLDLNLPTSSSEALLRPLRCPVAK